MKGFIKINPNTTICKKEILSIVLISNVKKNKKLWSKKKHQDHKILITFKRGETIETKCSYSRLKKLNLMV